MISYGPGAAAAVLAYLDAPVDGRTRPLLSPKSREGLARVRAVKGDLPLSLRNALEYLLINLKKSGVNLDDLFSKAEERRLKDEVARDLSEKSRRLHPRLMPEPQAAAYETARGKLAAGTRGGALKMLHHIRSVSVHPDASSPAEDETYIGMSARLQATMDILRAVSSRGERALVFIEHIKMQHRFVELVKRDEGFDLLVLGPKAAGTGPTLTAATHVIHLSRWWNPAVEEQCNDRVHRIGQTRPATVHVPIAIHPGYQQKSFDCLLHSLMTRKRRLASSALWPMGDTEEDAGRLQKMLADGGAVSTTDPVHAAMVAMFQRDESAIPPFGPDGSIPYG